MSWLTSGSLDNTMAIPSKGYGALVNYNPMDLTAAQSYGVQLAPIARIPTGDAWQPFQVHPIVDGSGMSTNAAAGNHLSLHWNNPLFWLLVFVLFFVGYVGFMFDFSVKRIGKAGLKLGKGE